ncbi:MAG: hypothetical protein COT37_01940 [Parcubacteria group bacterium CG08_land_8_20_14_0_20_43_9]|nr:MAG: hypothetical protein COT37_01940 [Parcubacteria group bacterium CG08_land_8_20_14_0_20_43_9]
MMVMRDRKSAMWAFLTVVGALLLISFFVRPIPTLVFTLIVVAILAVILSLVYFGLAPRNKFFTFVPEGTVKSVVRGYRVERVLIQWRGHYLDKGYNVCKVDESHPEEKHPLGGLRWYGFWPALGIYRYPFEWVGVKVDGTIQHHPREWLDYIILKDDQYHFSVEEAEDLNKLPLTLHFIVKIRVVNPYKALFVAENWLELTIQPLRAAVRDKVTEKTYDEHIKQMSDIGSDIFRELSVADGSIPGIEEQYGIKIVSLGVIGIDPPADYRAATLKKFNAEMEREATIISAEAMRDKVSIEADGDAARITKLAGGEVARLTKVYGAIQGFGDLGKLLRTLEAVEKSPLAASLSVQAIPGLQDVLRGVFGTQSATANEISQLRADIQKILEGLNPASDHK